ncbi:Rab-GAP TBC domain-containing protein [Entamoeba marina]
MWLFKQKNVNLVSDLLQSPVINLTSLRKVVFQKGIHGDNEHYTRSVVWKLLLNFYSQDKTTWDQTEEFLHKDYLSFLNDFFPSQKNDILHERNEFDIELLQEINKDVDRLFTRNPFFKDKNNRESIRHILYVQTKFNKTYPYVQGMNVLAAVLFYVFSQTTSRSRAESTTYYCFAFLMTQISNWFSPKLDWTSRGIHATLARVDSILALKEPDLYNHLTSLNITNTLYSFRWVTLLFAQEFNIETVLIIWDSVLVDPTGDFICCFCVSMITEIKKILLSGNFSDCLKALQKYPTNVSIESIMKRARKYYIDRMNFPPLVEPNHYGPISQ